MTLDATRENIKWLMEKLYETSRVLQVYMVKNPEFVLLCKTRAERFECERIIQRYFVDLYGEQVLRNVQLDISAQHRCSRFFFHVYNIRVILMDLE